MSLKHITHIPPADFLKAETRKGYTVSEKMKVVWAVQLDMVQKLVEVCQKHNLHIYAEGGTLLGAIRHKGFIPWDDDIDMVMMRKDFDSLMQLSHEFAHPYFLQSIYSDPHYTHRHAQLRNSETACWPVEYGKCPYKYNQGIFVDIFVADNMPITARGFSRYYKKEGLARQKFRLVSKFTNSLPECIYTWLRNHTKTLSDKARYAAYENVLREVPANANGYVCEISFQHSYTIESCKDYGEPQYVDFEHIKMPIPQNPTRLLALRFGDDFMTPRQAPSDHGNLDFDTDNSYTKHL